MTGFRGGHRGVPAKYEEEEKEARVENLLVIQTGIMVDTEVSLKQLLVFLQKTFSLKSGS